VLGVALFAVAAGEARADDRFPHLFSPSAVLAEPAEFANDSVPLPRQAPHRAPPKPGSAPPSVAASPSSSEQATTAPARVAAVPQAAAPVAPVPAPPTPAPANFVLASLTQAPVSFPAPKVAEPAAPNPTIATFAERFTFIVPIEGEASGKQAAATALADVPLPRPAPKRIRTLAVPQVAVPFEPISGDLAALIETKAKAHQVPLALAHAVVHVESRYNPNVTGRGGTHGLMQIKYNTAKGMGYDGTVRELYDPATNLEWGMRYLSGAHKLAKGDICGTVMRYQGGHRNQEMTDVATRYCGKVKALLARRNDAAAPTIARNNAQPIPIVAQASSATGSQAALSFQ
jgi:soluble lytic murein transglycosylase-like protein